VRVEPKDARSRPLFENWKTSARTDGKIPGGRIGEMAASLKTFMDLNPGHEQSVKLEPVLKKCDAARDWTPAEAAALLDEGMAADEAAVEKQGRRLLALGCKAVLIKGGHGDGAESIDYLVDSSGVTALAAPRIATKNTHGTGCSLSSAIAAGLAKGEDMESAVRNAKAWVSAAIAEADRFSVGRGHGPIHHFHKFY